MNGTLSFTDKDGARRTEIIFLNISVSYHTTAKKIGILPSTIHNIIKRFREFAETFAFKGKAIKTLH